MGISTFSVFTFTHLSCVARRYFTNACITRWSFDGKYTITRKIKGLLRNARIYKICDMYAVQCTYSTFIFTHILYIMKYNTKYNSLITINMYIVQCIDYTGYSTRTLCAVCEECSVFAIHHKYKSKG